MFVLANFADATMPFVSHRMLRMTSLIVSTLFPAHSQHLKGIS